MAVEKASNNPKPLPLSLLADREHLSSELRAAEGRLRRLAMSINGDSEQLENARLSCLRIRAELTKVNREVEKTIPPERVKTILLKLREQRLHEVLWSNESFSNPKLVDFAVESSEVAVEVGTIEVEQAHLDFSRRLSLVFGRITSEIGRQIAGLSLLVVTYLMYYYIDVNLQIATLPSSGLTSIV